MSIKVNLPDGRVVNFPDGMDPQQIAVKNLSVQSIGFFSTTTQDPDSTPSNASVITGALKTLAVVGSVTDATLSATRFGNIRIGGDLLDSSVRANGLINPASTSVSKASSHVTEAGLSKS